jgi:hypothetical protein
MNIFADIFLEYAWPWTFRNVSYGSVSIFVMFAQKFITFNVLLRQYRLQRLYIVIQCCVPSFSAYCRLYNKVLKLMALFFVYVPVIWCWKDTVTVFNWCLFLKQCSVQSANPANRYSDSWCRYRTTGTVCNFCWYNGILLHKKHWLHEKYLYWCRFKSA